MRGKSSPTKAFGAKGVDASVAKKAVKKSSPAAPKRPAAARAAVAARPTVVAPVKKAAPVAARSARAAKPAAAPAAARPSRNNNHSEAPRPSERSRDARDVKSKTSGRRAQRSVAAREPLHPVMPVLIPRPVPTDGKPRKNQAGLSSRELEHYRELLLAKRRELVGDMSSMEREALRSAQGSNLSNLPLHMADMGTDNYEQEFTLGLVEKDRQLLREINRALAKIQDGTYGICEGTGKPINKPRLEAQPWAKYSIDYARQMERGMLRR